MMALLFFRKRSQAWKDRKLGQLSEAEFLEDGLNQGSESTFHHDDKEHGLPGMISQDGWAEWQLDGHTWVLHGWTSQVILAAPASGPLLVAWSASQSELCNNSKGPRFQTMQDSSEFPAWLDSPVFSNSLTLATTLQVLIHCKWIESCMRQKNKTQQPMLPTPFHQVYSSLKVTLGNGHIKVLWSLLHPLHMQQLRLQHWITRLALTCWVIHLCFHIFSKCYKESRSLIQNWTEATDWGLYLGSIRLSPSSERALFRSAARAAAASFRWLSKAAFFFFVSSRMSSHWRWGQINAHQMTMHKCNLILRKFLRSRFWQP